MKSLLRILAPAVLLLSSCAGPGGPADPRTTVITAAAVQYAVAKDLASARTAVQWHMRHARWSALLAQLDTLATEGITPAALTTLLAGKLPPEEAALASVVLAFVPTVPATGAFDSALFRAALAGLRSALATTPPASAAK